MIRWSDEQRLVTGQRAKRSRNRRDSILLSKPSHLTNLIRWIDISSGFADSIITMYQGYSGYLGTGDSKKTPEQLDTGSFICRPSQDLPASRRVSRSSLSLYCPFFESFPLIQPTDHHLRRPLHKPFMRARRTHTLAVFECKTDTAHAAGVSRKIGRLHDSGDDLGVSRGGCFMAEESFLNHTHTQKETKEKTRERCPAVGGV